jgi:hypothetical protein
MRRAALVLTIAALLAAGCGSDATQSGPRDLDLEFNQAPIIRVDAQAVAVDLDGDGVETVTISAEASDPDPDGSVASYLYSRGLENVAFGPEYTDSFPVGETVVTLSVTDNDGLTDYQAVVVRVLRPYEQSDEDLSPEIDLWQNESFELVTGEDVPQRWFNISGNVDDPDGILEFSYVLNGGDEVPLSVGPNDRRLVREGDFNVDILRTSLVEGINTVELTAIDNTGESTVALVRIDNRAYDPRPFPIDIDWSRQDLDGLVEVVDGGWRVEGDELVMDQQAAGYDRLVAIGNAAWSDFEVETTVTVDQVLERIGPHSVVRGFGFLLRWNGHNVLPQSPGDQPQSGFYADGRSITPYGAYPLYVVNDGGGGRLTIQNHRGDEIDGTAEVQVEFGVTYNWKAQVQTVESSGSVYRAKLWPVGTSEPTDWQVVYVAGRGLDFEPDTGSLVLLSHESMTRWGDVRIDVVPEGDRLSSGEYDRLLAIQEGV